MQALIEGAAEAAYLCGDFEQLGRTFAQADRQLTGPSSALTELRIRAALAQNQLGDAIERAEESLARMPHQPLTPRWSLPFRRATRPLPADLTELTDGRLKEAFRLEAQLVHAGYHVGSNQSARLAQDIIIRASTAGYSAEVAFAFAAEAVRHVAIGKIEKAQVAGDERATTGASIRRRQVFDARADAAVGTRRSLDRLAGPDVVAADREHPPQHRRARL